MGDVLEVARHLEMGTKPITDIASLDDLPIIPMDELNTKYYLRFTVQDRPGVLAACADVFSKYDVSIQSVDQRGTKSREEVNLIFITHTTREGDMRKAIKEILSLENTVTGGFPVVIRVQD
jgi:homoserine dehydrogenase